MEKIMMNDNTDQAAAKSPMSGADLLHLVETVTAFLDNVENALGPAPAQLTALEKRRTGKPRKGATKILLSLAPVVQQHGLESSALSTAQMLSRLEDAETLQPLQARLLKLLKRIEDEVFSAQREAWELGLQFYALVKRRAKTDGELEANIEPVRSLFAFRHRLVKKEHPTKVQTRAKARLKSALSLATKHDVATDAEADPEGTKDELAASHVTE
jgi:hypothetical protein